MIAQAAGRIAHLGGPYGDLLSLSVDGGPFRTVASLGRREVAPQRRLHWEGETILVLEPATGLLLRPPLRLRRFSITGAEGAAIESSTQSEEGHWLSVLFERPVPGPLEITLCGVAAGGPASRRLRIDIDPGIVRKPKSGSGTPWMHQGTLWIPIREEGLARVGGAGAEFLRGPASRSVEGIDGRVVCVGRGGAFLDGRWTATSPGPYWPPYRAPLSGLAVRGIHLLPPAGGRVPRLTGSGPSGRLPPGRYSSLAALGDRLFAVGEAAGPALVPLRFDSPP